MRARDHLATGLAVALGIALSAPSLARGLCPADCNGDGEVTVDELVTSVNLGLGNGLLRLCPGADGDGNHRVTVDELVTGVNSALNGCPLSVSQYQAPAGLAAAQREAASQGVLPNGRQVAAAGDQIEVNTFPVNLVLTPDETRLIVTNDGYGNEDFQREIQVIDTASRSVTRTALPTYAGYLGVALSPDAQRVFVPNGPANEIDSLHFEGGALVADADAVATLPANTFPTSLAVSPDGRYLYALGFNNNTVTAIDLQTGQQSTTNDVGNFPYSLIVSSDGLHAFVTSWGLNNGNPVGLIPKPLPPLDPNVSAISSVDVLNLADPAKPTFKQYVPVGRSMQIDNVNIFGGSHPTGMALSPDGALLYVTATNLDLLVVIDAKTFAQVAEVALNQFDSGHDTLGLQGLYPEGVTASADGHRVYVADAGINAVQVIDVDPIARTFQVAGFIPAGWYPSAVALTHDGTRLYVANAKGGGVSGNGGDLVDISTTSLSDTPYYIGRIIKGSVSVIDGVDHFDLAAGTTAVRGANGFDPVSLHWVSGTPAAPDEIQRRHPLPVDFGTGPSSAIKHVVFILKENRTYDQVFGDLDLPGAERDNRLTLFGNDVTPNHHALARQFATGDNFYCDAEVSIPGHEWTDQGNDTDWTEKTWLFNYNGGGISDAVAQTGQEGFAKSGYLFQILERDQVPFRVYGEAFAILTRLASGIDGGGGSSIFPFLVQAAGSVSNLAAHAGDILAGNFAALTAAGINVDILSQQVWPNVRLDYPSNILPDRTDVERAQIFKSDLDQYVASGALPSFLFLWLPNDHTFGAAPSMPTPSSAVADNDAGLGMVVDMLSHSPFWKDMAIFVSEDDAQDGQDHVSAHRTIDLVMSPYVKRGYLSHVHHSNVGMLKTMELLLGIGPLSQYDRYATDMRDYFTTAPDLTPFTAVTSSMTATVNPPPAHAANAYLRQAGEVSEDLNFNGYDEAGPELSRVLWLVHLGERVEHEKRVAVTLTIGLTLGLIAGGLAMQRRRRFAAAA
ncbi:MAG TPA: bifunctional YncE family protein/alkaline phosphatase family protein [Candidatus Kryptonia bacterium]|nr:bifunctional YncE family protein/alkaline phosphatase family protein [Candidatus Kryptonia bacterium]